MHGIYLCFRVPAAQHSSPAGQPAWPCLLSDQVALLFSMLLLPSIHIQVPRHKWKARARSCVLAAMATKSPAVLAFPARLVETTSFALRNSLVMERP